MPATGARGSCGPTTAAPPSTRCKTPTVEAVSNAYVLARHPADHDRLYVACLTAEGSPELAGVWESTDGGRSFAVTGLTGRNCVSVAVCPAEPNRLLAGSEDGGILVSDDGGRRWRAGGLAGVYVASFAFDPAHPMTVVAATGGKGWATNDPSGFWRSDDSGQTWRQLPVAADRGGYQVAFDPSIPDTVYFAHQGGLSVSSDGGAEPTVLLDRPSDLGASVAVDTAGCVYYSGSNYRADTPGVLLASADRGRTWCDVGEGCATREVWSLTVDQVGRLWGSSFGSGLWMRPWAGAG